MLLLNKQRTAKQTRGSRHSNGSARVSQAIGAVVFLTVCGWCAYLVTTAQANRGGTPITSSLDVAGELPRSRLGGNHQHAATDTQQHATTDTHHHPPEHHASNTQLSVHQVEPPVVENMVLQLFDEFSCKGKVAEEKVNADRFVLGHSTKSMRLIGKAQEASLYSDRSSHDYVATLYEHDDCVEITNYPRVQSVVMQPSALFRKQINQQELANQLAKQTYVPNRRDQPSHVGNYRIVFSAESSEYFGYQVFASYYGFEYSRQSGATWTRLLTGGQRDDLADMGFTTFQAKRHLYSRRYSPINKPDVIAKWYDSPDAPEEEVIVVVDPDNWLLKDVKPWADKVSKGRALGEAAYYYGSKRATKLWRTLCLANCDADLDLVGVPYVVHRDDLKVIAPLWRTYSLIIKELMTSRNPKKNEFLSEYSGMGIEWAAEMFGYNFAAAHAGVKHDVIRRMQVRDVDSERKKSVLEPQVAMIHMGRAWFPKDYAPAEQWRHTEGKSFRAYGTQVWCKCNYTASTVIPWPVPEGADFQSTKTLEILHHALEEYGPIPKNVTFRKGTQNQRLYHHESIN